MSNSGSNSNVRLDSWRWYDAEKIKIEGRGWDDTPTFSSRLPIKAEKVVTKNVWIQSENSAGLHIKFRTDADMIVVRWTLTNETLSYPRMNTCVVSGIDIYGREENGRWVFIGNGCGRHLSNEIKLTIPHCDEYMLYFPLYNGLKELLIGVPKNETITQNMLVSPKPVVFYGTSSTQGACASRPGMAFTAIVQRALDIPLINLGFSEAGKMELEMAELLAELDASLYVIDSLWNMDIKLINERYKRFVLHLRNAKPNIPIILAEESHYLDKNPTEKGALVRAIYKDLSSQGVEKLYFLSNSGMLGNDGEGTVDGSHPNDLGMMRQARVFTECIVKILINKN